VGLCFHSFLEEIGRVYRITISRNIIEWRVLSFFFPLGKYRAIFIPKYFDFHISKVDTRHPFLSRLNVRKVSVYICLFLILAKNDKISKDIILSIEVNNFIY